MDSRLFFDVGDIVANILVGIAAGWLSWLVIGPGWPMIAAMVVAMALGMLVALLLFPALSYFWGAMEVMVPTMFSGMLSGMIVGMLVTMVPVLPGGVTFVGGSLGLLGIVVVWVVNNAVRGIRICGEEAS
jgi:hypothetical protein